LLNLGRSARLRIATKSGRRSVLASSRAIVSGICGDEWGQVASVTWPTVEKYADRHGIAFFRHRVDRFHRPGSWLKLLHMAQCFSLDGIEEVLWIDADVAVIDTSRNIFDEVPESATQAMCYRNISPPHWNAGVWLLRRRGLSVLVEAAMRDSCVGHDWWEQQAVNEIISERNIATHVLPEEWNAWTGSSVRPRFFHACGIKAVHDRVSALKSWLAESRQVG